MKQFILTTLLISNSLMIHQNTVTAAAEKPIIISSAKRKRTENTQALYPPPMELGSEKNLWSPSQKTSPKRKQEEVARNYNNNQHRQISKQTHPILMRHLQSKQMLRVPSQEIIPEELQEKIPQTAVTIWGHTGKKEFINRYVLNELLSPEVRAKVIEDGNKINEKKDQKTIMLLGRCIFTMPNHGNFHKKYSPVYLTTYIGHNGKHYPIVIYPSQWNPAHNHNIAEIREVGRLEALEPSQHSVIP